MSRPPLARERVLDAFEAILIADGERAATMEATARVAGVSKGGLLYHFGSKDALEAGLIERLQVLVDADIDAIASAEEGAIAYFIRTSAMKDSPLDRAIIAVTRLARGTDSATGEMLRGIREQWAAAIRPHAKDDTAVDLVMLVADGLYFNNTLEGAGMPGPVPSGPALDALVAAVESATRA